MRLGRLVRALFRVIKSIIMYAKFLSQCALKPRRYMDLQAWEQTDFSAPSPPFVKRICLSRNAIPGSTFIESGTFLGETTRFLGDRYPKVISIEPEENLFKSAELKFAKNPNIRIIGGTSEEIFPNLIPILRDEVSFWLDGHYSAGITFKGEKSTPIMDELRIIESHLSNFSKVVIMIDDIRCFDPSIPEYSDYPTRTYLVDWASRNQFSWTIEHDIFICRNFN